MSDDSEKILDVSRPRWDQWVKSVRRTRILTLLAAAVGATVLVPILWQLLSPSIPNPPLRVVTAAVTGVVLVSYLTWATYGLVMKASTRRLRRALAATMSGTISSSEAAGLLRNNRVHTRGRRIYAESTTSQVRVLSEDLVTPGFRKSMTWFWNAIG